ncbi:YiiD C-terminal domain-containing protein [Frateuria hangzhouensis]|uniref:YiiD C-terminal domain-containing protein n=1 Tax=Frateuria hangzhouensis TaxID=2995589 RepID=UPI002260AC9F|nr:YiiD C-terminal domain-containing protein [Frateuria sp. STR12]MCX7514501.1 YiiD C-terminal domain-containing protein [Frateuria sp. STR12]
MTDPQLLADDLLHFIRDRIPLARAMDLRLDHVARDSLALAAPLAPNVNDKGCAFGGSLASVMTLAGWALVELALQRRGEACDVFVGDSRVRYLEPVWSDFRAEARLAEEADFGTFFATLAERGKARIDVRCAVPGSGARPAATLEARFVAKRRAGAQ